MPWTFLTLNKLNSKFAQEFAILICCSLNCTNWLHPNPTAAKQTKTKRVRAPHYRQIMEEPLQQRTNRVCAPRATNSVRR